MRDLHDLASKAASQFGLLTSRQLRATGRTDTAVRELVGRGHILPITAGVFRLPDAPVSWEQQLLSVCLARGPRTVASHRSALRLWDLRSVDDVIEVTVRHPARRRLTRAIVHRSRDLQGSDISWVEGIPLTNPVRTICDAGAILPDHEVQRILDHAVATGLVTRSDLWRFRHRVGRQGRNGVGPFHRAPERLPVGAERTESGPELDLLRLCQEHGLPSPVPQLPIVAGGSRYRADLAFPEALVILEYDGHAFHCSAEQLVRDRRREDDLVNAGWTVLRFAAVDLGLRRGFVAPRVHRTGGGGHASRL